MADLATSIAAIGRDRTAARQSRWLTAFALALSAAVVPVLAADALLITRTQARLTDLATSNLQQRAISTASSIDDYLRARQRDIVLVSQLPDVIAYAQNLTDERQRDAARAALSGAAAISSAYESIAFVSLDGTLVAASLRSDEGTNIRFREYFQTARAGAPYTSDPSYSVITERPALFFSAPVRTLNGVLVGVVRSRIDLSQIWDLVESDGASVGMGAHATLVDDYGIRIGVSETKGQRAKAESYIYRPIAPIDIDTAKRLAADKRFGQRTAEQLVIDPDPQLRAVIDTLPARGATTYTASSPNGEQLAVATRLSVKPWVYAVAMPATSYTAAIGMDPIELGLVLLLAAALALVVSVLFVRSPRA